MDELEGRGGGISIAYDEPSGIEFIVVFLSDPPGVAVTPVEASESTKDKSVSILRENDTETPEYNFVLRVPDDIPPEEEDLWQAAVRVGMVLLEFSWMEGRWTQTEKAPIS